MPIRTEEALEFLIGHLASIPSTVTHHRLVNSRYAHMYLPNVVARFWQPREPRLQIAEMTDEQYAPFYDAAWELARVGVLRPGRVAPKGQEMATDFGDLWSITQFGFSWLADASRRPFLDMSRISEIFAMFTRVFGPGFGQRAVEGVKCYRTANYLAACAMVGAAAESIILALAIAKSGDEARMMKTYQAAGGRARITSYIVGQSTRSAARQFEAALHILHFWRDDASHGAQTTISEVEAHAAISELLRLAQFASDHWDTLTAPS